MKFALPLFFGLCLFGAIIVSTSRSAEVERTDRADRMEWWRDARFGMFVHWGLYSGLAGEWDGKSLGSTGNMEWNQQRVKADTDTYAAQAIPRFKPKPGFAKEWANLAKAAGCKYLVFTTKHHEGFALHDSKVSEFDAGSVLQRDLVREIVDACRAEGLKVGFYHSVIDWHHPQFAYAESKEIPHPLRDQPYPNGSRNQQEYIKYLHAQVDELVSNYGPVDILWWDYSVPDFQGEKAWGAFELTDLVRQKQPAVIMNNRLFRRPEAGWTGTAKVGSRAALDPKYGDFMTPEQQVPDTGAAGVDWETCMTMNTTWGFSKYDHDWKSANKLIETLIEVVSKGGNFLLNVGPTADGTIPPESVERLQEVGRWLAVNGESIYGASASPIPKPVWGRVTQKPNEGLIYLHVLEWPADGRLIVAGLPGQAAGARVVGTDHDLALAQENDSIVITLPDADRASLPTVVRLQLASPTAPVEKDKSLHSDGSPWGLRQAKVEDPTRPRVLLIGDSILNGYRNDVVENLNGEAYVDAWVNPYYQSDAVNKALAKVLDTGPYEIVHFNIGLHGYQEGRIKPEEFKPLTRAYVEVLKSKLPKAKLIWASSTPVTVKGKPLELDPEINPTIVDHNRMAAEVMAEEGVAVNDFYGLLVDKRDLARGDSFHWNGPAYKLLGAKAAESIQEALSNSASAQ